MSRGTRSLVAGFAFRRLGYFTSAIGEFPAHSQKDSGLCRANQCNLQRQSLKPFMMSSSESSARNACAHERNPPSTRRNPVPCMADRRRNLNHDLAMVSKTVSVYKTDGILRYLLNRSFFKIEDLAHQSLGLQAFLGHTVPK